MEGQPRGEWLGVSGRAVTGPKGERSLHREHDETAKTPLSEGRAMSGIPAIPSRVPSTYSFCGTAPAGVVVVVEEEGGGHTGQGPAPHPCRCISGDCNEPSFAATSNPRAG